jgi:aminoglycoside phosphotransferase
MVTADTQIIEAVIKKNGLKDTIKPERFSSGVVNRVYNLADTYVLKIEAEGGAPGEPILKPAADLTPRLVAKAAKVPRVLDYGSVEGTEYILMEKVRGRNLSYDWMSLSNSKKEKLIAQLAEQLQIFHSLRFDRYCIMLKSQKCFENLRPAIQRLDLKELNLIQKEKLPKEFVSNVEILEQFYYDHIEGIDETETAVLCHNDIHLENIFYEDDLLTGIIDLDWISQAPRDYELWKILDTFHEPKYTVEEPLRPLYEGYQMTKELGWLKKNYPELFAASGLADRIRLFYIDPLAELIVDCQNGRWSEEALVKVADKVRDFYCNQWLDHALA